MIQRKLAAAGLVRLGLAMAGLCFAGVGPVAAQTAGATSKPPLDPERIAIARQIYDEIGVSTLQSMSKTMISSLQSAMTKTVSGLDAQRQQAMLDAVADSVSFMIPKAVDATVDAMAEDFDKTELKDILAFYTSPTGRVMIHKMPQIMQQSTATMVKALPEMMHQMEVRYCTKVTCTESEHQAFAAIAAQMKARAPG
jgi:hypothetical protein